jgi:TetR/AcrR family transcriptional regulator
MPASPPATSAPRDQILDAAEALFARQGFDRTTIKQIGAGAGVNSALLYYYYTDKEQLYRATLDRLVRRIVPRAMERLNAPGTPAERVRSFLELQAEFMGDHPHFYPILLRELVDHGAKHAVAQIQLVAATMFRRLCEVIEEGQRSGEFRRTVDPRFAAISTVAVLAHFFTARPAIGLFLGGTTAGPPRETVRDYVRHAVEYALAALAAVPVATKAPKPARKS